MFSLADMANNMNQHIPSLSVIVIARNEEIRIAKCLASVSWTNERIVIDNDSKDTTATIASRNGARVVTVGAQDFSTLRNIGKDQANGPWLLYVDADETIGQTLRGEIERVTASVPKDSDPVAYYIRRHNRYLGVPWPQKDKMQRLFWKPALDSWHGAVHETATVTGTTAILSSPLEHDTHRTLEEMVTKTNEWSDIEAHLRFEAHHPRVVWWRLLRVMKTGFFQSYIKENGWRAGTVGIIEGIYQAFSMFITYAKLWEMQKKVQSVK